MSPTTTSPRMSQAMTDLERLFPGQRVEIAPDRDRTRAAHGFDVLPSLRRPRLLVPARNTRAAAASILRFSHVAGWDQRLGKLALSALVRSGLAHRLNGDVVSLPTPGKSPTLRSSSAEPSDIRSVLSASLGEPVEIAMGIGAVRANGKPVVQVLSSNGTTLAFAKIAVSDLSKSLVRHEAAVLQELSSAGTSSFHAPQVLDTVHWSGLEILVLSALATPLRRYHRGSAVPVRPMIELAEVGGLTSCAAGDTPLAGELRRVTEVTGPGDDELSATYHGIVSALMDRHGGTELRNGHWHGDWGPWNMAWTRHGLHLWDWERCSAGVPLGSDALHYRLQPLLRRPGTTQRVNRLRELAAATLKPFGISEHAADAVTAMYLAAVLARYIRDLETDHGEALRPLIGTVMALLGAMLDADVREPRMLDLHGREECL